jgi:phosphoribosylformylglycinamidine synthase subunit PurSL
LVDDIGRAVTSDLKAEGNPLYLVGRSAPELGGSLWARRHGKTGLALPRPDPAGLRRLGESLLSAGRRGFVRAVHDVSDGGLAVTLAEMAFGGALGFTVDLDATGLASPSLALAAEGASRFVVEVPDGKERQFERIVGAPRAVRLGSVAAAQATLRWGGASISTFPVLDQYPSWRNGLGLP